MRRTIEIIAFATAILIAALAVHAWLSARNDQRQLQSTLAAQKQLIDAAGARETARDATLQQTLAQIDALKRASQTPAEILRDLPKYLTLPAPIALSPSAASRAPRPVGQSAEPAAVNQQGTDAPRESATPSSASTASTTPTSPPPNTASPASPSSSAPSAEIPAADLKPLYDYVQDCRACQARLAAATQNAADDASKIAALTRERDAAITASKGGSFWQRFRRNALWLAVGAGLGYAAHR